MSAAPVAAPSTGSVSTGGSGLSGGVTGLPLPAGGALVDVPVVGNEPTKPPPPFPPPQAVSNEATKIRDAGVFKNVSFDAWMQRL
jgi:hypothetical protein